MNKILSYLDELFPNPKCELNYTKDYELLIAVMLSAQTTDKKVNKVTEILFKKYPTINDLKDAKINDIEDIIKEIKKYGKEAFHISDYDDIKTYLSEYVNKGDLILTLGAGYVTKLADLLVNKENEWYYFSFIFSLRNFSNIVSPYLLL